MNKSVIGLVLALILILAMTYVIVSGRELLWVWAPYQWGVLVVLTAYALSVAVTGNLNPLALGAGDDGRLSLSKAQTLFWTFIVLYAYTALYALDVKICSKPGNTCVTDAANRAAAHAAAVSGNPAPANDASGSSAPPVGTNALIPIDFPGSVLLLLGFSVTSLIAAAGITRSQIASGIVKKSQARPPDQPDLALKWLVQTDDGRVDLTRFQVVLWTLVAAGAFVADTQLLLTTGVLQLSLPDVGSALVLLMGLGQAAYVGGKLVVTAKPHVFRIVPAHAPVGAAVSLSGAGFGTQQGATSFLLMGGAPVLAANVTSWSDTAIVFTVPGNQPGGGAWPAPSATVPVVVAVGPVESDPVAFTVP